MADSHLCDGNVYEVDKHVPGSSHILTRLPCHPVRPKHREDRFAAF